MPSDAHRPAPAVIPVLRYEDAPAALEWLCAAFGFEQRLVVAGEGDMIAHAQLALDDGMVILSSAREDGLGMRTPQAVGAATQSVHVVVDDPDAHFAKATGAGARVVQDLHDGDAGRGYLCADPEGNLWFFGTYRPGAPDA